MLMLGDISGNNAENRRRELYTRTHIVDDSIGGAKTKTKTKTKKQRTMTTLPEETPDNATFLGLLGGATHLGFAVDATSAIDEIDEIDATTTLQEQYNAFHGAASQAMTDSSKASSGVITANEKLISKGREIAQEHLINKPWTAERLEQLERLNSEFIELVGKRDQCKAVVADTDAAFDELMETNNFLEIGIAKKFNSMKYGFGPRNTPNEVSAAETQLANIKSLERAKERLETLKSELCKLESERVQVEQNAAGYSVELSEIDEEIQDVRNQIQATRHRVQWQS